MFRINLWKRKPVKGFLDEPNTTGFEMTVVNHYFPNDWGVDLRDKYNQYRLVMSLKTLKELVAEAEKQIEATQATASKILD